MARGANDALSAQQEVKMRRLSRADRTILSEARRIKKRFRGRRISEGLNSERFLHLGFSDVSDGEYKWTPEPFFDGTPFREILSGYHVGMDELYELQSYWIKEIFHEFDVDKLEDFKRALDGAVDELKSIKWQAPVPVDEVEFLIDGLNKARAFARRLLAENAPL